MHTIANKEEAPEAITYVDFCKLDIRVGTVLSAVANAKAIKPMYVIEIDFGEVGVLRSSAQLTQNYAPEELVGKQLAAVVNFPPKRIAGVESKVLVLAAVDGPKGSVLLTPTLPVSNGDRVY